MPQKRMSSLDMLDREFLNIRCRLLEIGAALDRIDRGDQSEKARRDPRYDRIQQALGRLAGASPARAEAVQMLFSDSYNGG